MTEHQITIDYNNHYSRSNINIAIISKKDNIINFYEEQISKSINNNNSGFDLVVENDVIFDKYNHTQLVPLGIKCAPQFNSGYMLCPRSSIYKTPLRMANSIGIVDMEYRGQIMAPIDFILSFSDTEQYILKEGTRLFQLCHPSLVPMNFNKIDESELDITVRGINGFGSSG